MDNIQGIGNKYNYLLNSTIYTLESPKITQGENQIFNISGVIKDPKPKFGKGDLNLSVPVKYENKTEEKVLQCNIIDIIGNNYTLSCFGIKYTNFSLANAMSVIDDEVLIIRFDENANSTIIDYSDENTTTYNSRLQRRFRVALRCKSGDLLRDGQARRRQGLPQFLRLQFVLRVQYQPEGSTQGAMGVVFVRHYANHSAKGL